MKHNTALAASGTYKFKIAVLENGQPGDILAFLKNSKKENLYDWN